MSDRTAATPTRGDSELTEYSALPPAPSRHLLRRTTLPAATLVAVGLLWQGLVGWLHVPIFILPPPSKFLVQLVTSRAILWSATLVTGQEVLYGFLVAALVSIPLGFVLATIPVVRDALYPLVVFFQVIPKIAIAPIFVVWFGIGEVPVTVLTFTLCFFPIAIDSMTGFSELEPRLLYLTKSMGASRWQTFIRVRVPSSLPYVFSGLKVGIVFATTGAIVGEFIGSNAGLGYLLDRATGFLDTPLVFADLVVLSVFGIVLAYAMNGVQWLVMPWRRSRH
ncbi:MAG TPA: ABC transporter permease [Candidatus Dormibacteraeota bacterium]|nr:ABC transporter permease [Candidatus Dormibacteraeota bacterium]